MIPVQVVQIYIAIPAIGASGRPPRANRRSNCSSPPRGRASPSRRAGPSRCATHRPRRRGARRSAETGLRRRRTSSTRVTSVLAINPGYFSPRAEWGLFEASADRRWTDITRTQRVLGWQLIGTGMLPPDWATVSEVGHAVPTAPSTGGPIGFGLDAARLPVRFAESCDREDRALAGAMGPVLTAPGEVPALRNLNGSLPAIGSIRSPWSPPRPPNRAPAIPTVPSNVSTRRRNWSNGLRPITAPPGWRSAASC